MSEKATCLMRQDKKIIGLQLINSINLTKMLSKYRCTICQFKIYRLVII